MDLIETEEESKYRKKMQTDSCDSSIKQRQFRALFSEDTYHLAGSQKLAFGQALPPEIDRIRRIVIKAMHKE